jgi:hypothetical protein
MHSTATDYSGKTLDTFTHSPTGRIPPQVYLPLVRDVDVRMLAANIERLALTAADDLLPINPEVTANLERIAIAAMRAMLAADRETLNPIPQKTSTACKLAVVLLEKHQQDRSAVTP